jgi:hypothetical protein
MLYALKFGWGGRIRTSESRFQRPVSYRLTTPQSLISKFLNPNIETRNNSKIQMTEFQKNIENLCLGHLTWNI